MTHMPQLRMASTALIILPFTGKDWIKQMLLAATLFPFCVCGIAFMINFIAIYYHASRAIPFLTMVKFLTSYLS